MPDLPPAEILESSLEREEEQEEEDETPWEKVSWDKPIIIAMENVDRAQMRKVKDAVKLLKTKADDKIKSTMHPTDYMHLTKCVQIFHCFASKQLGDHLLAVINSNIKPLATTQELELSHCNKTPEQTFEQLDDFPLLQDKVDKFQEFGGKERARDLIRALEPCKNDKRVDDLWELPFTENKTCANCEKEQWRRQR